MQNNKSSIAQSDSCFVSNIRTLSCDKRKLYCRPRKIQQVCAAQTPFKSQNTQSSTNGSSASPDVGRSLPVNSQLEGATLTGSDVPQKAETMEQRQHGEKESSEIAGKNKRVMCLMSDTGGGHRASAQALRDAFELLYGDEFSIKIVDLWSHNSPWPFDKMPKSYFFLVKNPWLWRLNFRCSEPRFLHEVMFKGYAAIVARNFTQAFIEVDPHLIVSVHPLMQHVPLNIIRRMSGSCFVDVPFATVVTDLTRCHSTWFHKLVDKCFVATKLVAAQALSLGLTAEQVVCHGLPIRPSFGAPRQASKADIRSKLGLDTEAATVMLVGGGEGMGKLQETAEALARTLSHKHQVVVICGRNAKLTESLRMRKWPLKLHVKGFVNNMAEYMVACDCIISKAGPGTIAEAMICGIPIVLNGCIPCQEEGNIPYVIENGVGAYSEEPQTIAHIVAGWLDPQNTKELQNMSMRAQRLGRPDATYNIVRDLARMAV